MNDPNFSFTSKPQLTRWANEARRNCAKRTGCIRRLITGQSAFGASAQPGFAVPGGMQPGALPGAFPQAGSGTYGAVQNAMMTIPGVERYPYVGFFNPVLQAQYAGCALAPNADWPVIRRRMQAVRRAVSERAELIHRVSCAFDWNE